jgi:hypothetical protein
VLLDDIGAYAAGLGVGNVGSTGDYGIFLGTMPDDLDKVFCFYEYPGMRGTYTLGMGLKEEYPSVQAILRVPESAYSTGRQRMETLYEGLGALKDQVINGRRYDRVEALQAPFFLKRDEKRRLYFACNFRGAVSV